MPMFTLRTGHRIRIESLDVELVQVGLLALAGTLSSMTTRNEFRRLLEGLHAQINAQRITRFVVDVRRLSFVDSSAIRVFVDWISHASAARYRLAFRIDPSVTWHRLSFSVLKSLAPDTVEIVDEAGLGARGEPPT